MSPPGPNPLTPLIDSLRRALQDRYTIERALGAAGAARAAAQTRALAPDGLEAALATGYHEAFVRGDPARAVEAYRAGLAAAPDNAVLLMNLGRAERALGRWDAALEHFERAHAVDPRSGLTAWALAYAYLTAGRLAEAMTTVERGLLLTPGHFDLIETKAMVHLAGGDLAAAQRVARTPPAGVAPEALITHFALYWDLYWLLDDQQQQVLARLPLSAYDGDRGSRALLLAQLYHFRGDTARSRAHADSARGFFTEQLRGAPDDRQRVALRALALAYAGRFPEAISEGRRAVGMQGNAEWAPYYNHLLARVYLLAGERDQAVEEIERLLGREYFVKPGWLRVDPNFDELRGHPDFEALARRTE